MRIRALLVTLFECGGARPLRDPLYDGTISCSRDYQSRRRTAADDSIWRKLYTHAIRLQRIASEKKIAGTTDSVEGCTCGPAESVLNPGDPLAIDGPPAKRARMHEVVVAQSNNSAASQRSVASRFKKLHQQQHNGTAAAAAERDAPVVEVSSAPASNPVPLTEADKNVIRLIGQHLKSLGMNAAVQALVDESGCKLESPAAARFRMHVVNGNWDMVLTDLKALKEFVVRPQHLKQMKFFVLEQKYLELVEKGDTLEALSVLRAELTPLGYGRERVHELSTFLMVKGGAELRAAAGWAGSSLEGRQVLLDRLQAFLPPAVMLPPKRLDVLLRQAWQWQVSRCPLHNANAGDSFDAPSLLVDHHCKHVGFPTTTRQILHDHMDEVWCTVFSPCGKYLATGAKEPAVYVFKVNSVTKTVEKYRTLDGHACGAAYLSWSADSKYLAVAGTEESYLSWSADSKYLAVAGTEDASPDIWVWNVERGELKRRVSNNPEDSLSVIAWHKCGRRIACGGQKGQFYQCDINDGQQQQPEVWEGFRIRGLWCKNDGRTVLASDTHHRIRAYTFDDMRDYTVITESAPLIYFCVDATERYALCTIKDHGLHLWDMETRSLVKRFTGSKHGDYVIFSCFGGYNQSFVATGSEDNCVYIWHRDREEPVKVLRGHSLVVNA
uniref:WD repeat-containing protein 26 n=1 Tax=Plectus sambesii TaxID=2011161 RepID=A0A914WIH5_9BILA